MPSPIPVRLLVAPRVSGPIEARARCAFPLGFGWQALPGPLTVLVSVVPINVMRWIPSSSVGHRATEPVIWRSAARGRHELGIGRLGDFRFVDPIPVQINLVRRAIISEDQRAHAGLVIRRRESPAHRE